jgi:AcrR family transcriptional regulator
VTPASPPPAPAAEQPVRGHAAGRGRGARGPYAKGNERRARIVATAFEFFGTRGYHGVSMLEIADACGVTRPGLLHHFPTKEAILEEVLKMRDERAARLFFDDGPAESEDGIAYFARLIRVAEYNAHDLGLVRLFAMLSTEAADPAHPAHDYYVARYRRSLARTRAAIDNLSRRGLLRPGVHRDGLDAEIIALMDGLQIQMLLTPGSVDMARVLRARFSEIIDADLDVVAPTSTEGGTSDA